MKRLFNNYFPTSSYLTMNSFAINISDHSIKYGELVNTSAGLRFGKHGKEKVPQGVIVSGKIEKESELVTIFKKIKERENVHFIRVSIPEEQIYLFTLSVPIENKNNLRDIILFQMEEHIPIKAVDSVFDYDVVSEDEQNVLIEVVATASATIEGYLSVFNKVGLVPLSFEIEAQAIARAVIPAGETRPVMIVDFGDTRTGVSIFKDGHIFLTTTLAIGGIDLTNMIAKYFSLPFEEAEKMKHEYGLNQSSKADNIFPAILNEISVLRDELNKQYEYWELHSGKDRGKIDRMILCGGDANLAGLADYLGLSMKIKVENANVWVNILDTKDSVPDMPLEESLGYATVIGLSLDAYSGKSQSLINILPDREKKLVHAEYKKRFFIVLLNFIAATSVVASLLLFPSYFLSKLKENIIDSKLEEFNKENSNLVGDKIDTIIGDINTKLGILDSNKTPYQVTNKVIDNVLSSRTKGITITQIFFDRPSDSTKKEFPTIRVQGKAVNRDSLRNFKTSLDNNGDFSSVDLPISDFLEKSDLSFNILITMK